MDQIEKHKEVLKQIESLKQYLKTEVANRKQTELDFEAIIEKRANEINERFHITYLNNLYEMRAKIKSFEERQAKIDAKSGEMKAFIETELNKQKEALTKQIKIKQTEFEAAYK